MRMVNIRDGMQDWDYLWAIGHYGAGDFTEPGYPIGDDIARALTCIGLKTYRGYVWCFKCI